LRLGLREGWPPYGGDTVVAPFTASPVPLGHAPISVKVSITAIVLFISARWLSHCPSVAPTAPETWDIRSTIIA